MKTIQPAADRDYARAHRSAAGPVRFRTWMEFANYPPGSCAPGTGGIDRVLLELLLPIDRVSRPSTKLFSAAPTFPDWSRATVTTSHGEEADRARCAGLSPAGHMIAISLPRLAQTRSKAGVGCVVVKKKRAVVTQRDWRRGSLHRHFGHIYVSQSRCRDRPAGSAKQPLANPSPKSSELLTAPTRELTTPMEMAVEQKLGDGGDLN